MTKQLKAISKDGLQFALIAGSVSPTANQETTSNFNVFRLTMIYFPVDLFIT